MFGPSLNRRVQARMMESLAIYLTVWRFCCVCKSHEMRHSSGRGKRLSVL